LGKLAAAPRRLKDIGDDLFATTCWNETIQQRDGTLLRKTGFVDSPGIAILSGPHFFVANPFYKTPRAACPRNSDYDVVDLEELTEEYLPRYNYIPACNITEYRRRAPRLSSGTSALDCWRVVFSQMLSTNGERTLQPALIPPKAAYVHTVIGFAFTNSQAAVTLAGWCSALPVDFLVKTSGQGHLYWSKRCHLAAKTQCGNS